MLLNVDPWSKAVECERAIERMADPERRTVIESLRSFWVAIGDVLLRVRERDESDHVSLMSRMQTQLSVMTKIHTQLMAGCRSAMH